MVHGGGERALGSVIATVEAASPRAQAERRVGEESATVLTFDGRPQEQAIRIQHVQVLGPEHQDGGAKRAGHWRVLAPVTERGEAIGLLELFLPREPGAETVAEIAGLKALRLLITFHEHGP